jgi:hypothetical protein
MSDKQNRVRPSHYFLVEARLDLAKHHLTLFPTLCILSSLQVDASSIDDDGISKIPADFQGIALAGLIARRAARQRSNTSPSEELACPFVKDKVREDK